MSGPTAGTATHHLVHEVRNLSDSTYVLRFDRGGIEFEPGQYISVGIAGEIEMREYSVYSSPPDEYLEILVKEVTGGAVSKRLRTLAPGSNLNVDGPFGFFTMDPSIRKSGNVVFIATGTGISPFHCFARAYPDLSYQLIHGVRHVSELYEHETFAGREVISCISRQDPDEARSAISNSRVLAGRVTDYLRDHSVDPESHFFLCGSCDMIYEAFDVLKSKGAQPEHLYAEVYF